MSYVVKRKTEDPAPPLRPRSTQDCPKCQFSMEPLRNSAVLNRDFGFSLDSASGFDPDNNPVTSLLFGSLSRFLYRNVIGPLGNHWIGERQNRRFRKILDEYPNSLICTHCEYVLKRK